MAVLTGTTCGAACWYAREDICRCSCGGANHGILVTGDEQPRRNCLIKGTRYVLGMVGSYLDCDRAISGFRHSEASKPFHSVSGTFTYLVDNMSGAPIWHKSANDRQITSWPEVNWMKRASLLWVRVDVADVFDAWLADWQVSHE
jgi:hypothetical protein